MNLPSEKELNRFKRWNVAPPAHSDHGITDTWENPIKDQLKGANHKNWRLEGNKLMCDTDFGPLVQVIPTDYICKGTDSKGLPILEKIVL